MTYRLVIFDFDGTLADSFPWFLTVMNEVADQYGFRKIHESELPTLRTYDSRQMVKHLGVSWWKLPFIARHMRRRMAANLHAIPLYDGVPGVLRRLAGQGTTLAVVSSNAEANIRRVLGPEAASTIRYYEGGVSLFGKRAGFRSVLRRSGIPPSEALCVGDEIRDAEAAREANIAFAGVSWGFASEASLRPHAPLGVFATLDELVEQVALTGAPAPQGAI